MGKVLHSHALCDVLEKGFPGGPGFADPCGGFVAWLALHPAFSSTSSLESWRGELCQMFWREIASADRGSGDFEGRWGLTCWFWGILRGIIFRAVFPRV
jgi:hypothetical protein